MKRSLLDKLAAGHDFDVPQGMVDAEFEQIWQQLQQEAQKDADPDAAMKEIEAEKDDYRSIAERRVRLGLLLSEIGQKNNVQITSQEMSQLIQQAASSNIARKTASVSSNTSRTSRLPPPNCARRSMRTRWLTICSNRLK